jgi:outer membrane protein G
MKKIIFLAVLFTSFVNAQVFTGKGDLKLHLGANIQDHGTGVTGSLDYGLGSNMSVGFSSIYLLGVEEILGDKPNVDERFDLRARFNANIADVFGIEDNFDIYPGLNVGLKNFGAHLGARYFFTDGFGIYSEVQFPIAQYDQNVQGFEKYNNQFNLSIGASFNL